MQVLMTLNVLDESVWLVLLQSFPFYQYNDRWLDSQNDVNIVYREIDSYEDM